MFSETCGAYSCFGQSRINMRIEDLSLMAPSRIPALIEETRSLIEELQQNLLIAEGLRETCRTLRYDHADFRDFLHETRLTVLSRYPRQTEK